MRFRDSNVYLGSKSSEKVVPYNFNDFLLPTIVTYTTEIFHICQKLYLSADQILCDSQRISPSQNIRILRQTLQGEYSYSTVPRRRRSWAAPPPGLIGSGRGQHICDGEAAVLAAAEGLQNQRARSHSGRARQTCWSVQLFNCFIK